MANRILDVIFNQGTHKVGTLNTRNARHLVNGAKITVADIDNFLLVELVGYDSEGVRICKPLSSNTVEGFLLTTVEEEDLFGDGNEYFQGNYNDFYNKVGDMARLTILEPSFTRFETSAYTLNTGVTSAVKGYVAHYDVTTKSYIVSNPATPHADYSASANKFTVVDVDTDFGYNIGQPCIRLEKK